MPAVFTIYNRPRGYDQTQKKFTLDGSMAITGTYTSGMGIAFSGSVGLLNSDGSTYNLPPTYTGSNGPGQGVPIEVDIFDVQGYITNYIAGFIRIYTAAGTELTTGTVPAAVSAAGLDSTLTYLRG